jgi:hypothetical protein
VELRGEIRAVGPSPDYLYDASSYLKACPD